MGPSRRQRALIGTMFVFAAVFVAGVLLRVLEIARGAPPLPVPKAEDGLLFLGALIAVVIVPHILGTRVARLFWRSRIRFYIGTTSINSRSYRVGADSTTQYEHRVRAL
jgi:hypothetical protein